MVINVTTVVKSRGEINLRAPSDWGASPLNTYHIMKIMHGARRIIA